MEIKITAKLENESIKVNAQYSRQEEATDTTPAGMVVVHEVNTAFVLGTSEEEIRAELEKQGELFEAEEKGAEAQAEVDRINDEANEVINNLNK